MAYQTDQPSAPPLPGLSGLRIAWRQLVAGDDTSPIDTSAVYYPLVGLALGAAMAVVDHALIARTSPLIASTAVVGLHVLATRGRPVAGLARTACRFVAAPLARSTAAVAIIEVALFAAAVWIVTQIVDGRLVALLFAPMLGRSAMVVMATGSRQARDDERLMRFSRELTFREFGIASTAAFALVFATTNFLGFLLVLVTGLATIALRVLLHWRLGGVDRDSLHATGEVVQLAVFGLMAVL